jgi:hypothetical protein
VYSPCRVLRTVRQIVMDFRTSHAGAPINDVTGRGTRHCRNNESDWSRNQRMCLMC